MAMTDFNRTPGLLLAALLAVSLGACSSAEKSRVQLLDAAPKRDLSSRDASDITATVGNYSSVVPRAYLSSSDLAEDAPDTYTVVKGDTLWDISDRFLKKAWLWPQIWSYNPQIANPHLIYPGDTIALEYIDGRPTMVLVRNGKRINPFDTAGSDASGTSRAANGGRQRLSPRIRASSLDEAIPTIHGEAISQFLIQPLVVANEELDDAPYVLGTFDGRLMSAVGHQVYARGPFSRDLTSFGVYRKSKPLVDPDTGRVLGHEVIHVGNARLLEIGDPSTLLITSNKQETMAGDLLLPNSASGPSQSYVPRLPVFENGEGRVVSLYNAISQSGRNQIVVLNLGKEQSVKEGDVLAIEASGPVVIDRHGKRRERVQLPSIRNGVAMVFKVFDEVSYALVMESERPISAGDIVTGL